TISRFRSSGHDRCRRRSTKLVPMTELVDTSHHHAAPTTKPRSFSRAGKGGLRRRDTHVPRERVVIPAPCACPVCGGRLVKPGGTSPKPLRWCRAGGR